MKHIKLHLITFVIVACMFMLCPFASAEEMAYNQQEIIEQYISSELPSYSSAIISALREHVFPYCQYFGTYKISYFPAIIINFVSDISVMPVDIYSSWSSPPCQIQVGISNSSGSRGGLVSLSSKSLSNYYGFRFIYYNGTWQLKGVKNYSGAVDNKYGDTYFGGGSLVQYAGTSSGSNSSWFNPWDVAWTKSYGYGPVWIASSSDRQYVIYSSNNTEPVLYTEDERLKFALVDNIYGGKNLMTDIRQFINDFPIQDTSHSSVLLYPESITLTYSVDNVEKTLVLDSSNSTIKSKYIFETDLSNFDFDDSVENVIITKCDFTISGNTQSGQTETQNYKISCDYYLKRFVQPLVPGSNPYKSDVNGDQTSQETKDSLEYLVTFREGYGLDFDEFSDLSFPDYYTYADVYLYNNTAAYNYIIDNILSVNAVAYIIQNLANSEDDVIKQIGLFLDDSNYGEYYDVIVFDWIQETSSSYTHTYFYFETVSGRVKASTQFLQIMQDDLNKVKINTAAAFTAIDNFENESIQFFNAKLGFDENILGWVKTIDNSINNLDFPTYDDSNILSVLGQIKDLLSSPANEIDTPQECIQLYEAHPNYFEELWGTSPSLRSASRASNPFSGSEFVRADLVPAWWEGKTLTMIYLIKNDGSTSRFYNDMLNGLYTAYDNLISSNNAFNDYINSLFKYNFDYSGSFYGHLFSLDYNPEDWSGGFYE